MAGVFLNNVSVSVQAATPSVSCTINAVASSATEILLMEANPTRKGIIIFNESVYRLYIKFGIGVSSESFTVTLPPESTYEMSQTILYSGQIYGVWDDVDGFVHITELS